jgi:hypothetical protein
LLSIFTDRWIHFDPPSPFTIETVALAITTQIAALIITVTAAAMAATVVVSIIATAVAMVTFEIAAKISAAIVMAIAELNVVSSDVCECVPTGIQAKALRCPDRSECGASYLAMD